MNQTSHASEARHAAAAIRDLNRILTRADKRIAAAKPRRPAVQTSYGYREVMQMLGIKSAVTLFSRVRDGRVPPSMKPPPPVGAEPGGPEYRHWQRLHRRWNASLMFAFVHNILPDEVREFKSPEDWVEWLRDHFAHEEFTA